MMEIVRWLMVSGRYCMMYEQRDLKIRRLVFVMNVYVISGTMLLVAPGLDEHHYSLGTNRLSMSRSKR